MPNEKIIEQLRSLIDEAKTHFTDDGDDLIFRDDAAVFVHELAVQNSRDTDVIAALQDKDATQDALIKSLKVRIRAVKEEIESA